MASFDSASGSGPPARPDGIGVSAEEVEAGDQCEIVRFVGSVLEIVAREVMADHVHRFVRVSRRR